MKRVLIIGGTRFVGPVLIKKLLRDGASITVFNRGNNYGKSLPKSIRRVIGDRSIANDIKKLLGHNYDLIYDMICFDPNDASLLLNILQPRGHIVFFSSAAVYKKTKTYPLYETSKLGAWPTFGDYGERKIKVEKKYVAYCQENNLKLAILRPTYLLGDDNYFDRENYFFSRIINNNRILMPGASDSMIQFGFLEDTAEAFYRIPKMQKKQIETVNIGGNDLISIKNFVLLCGKIVGKKPKLIHIPNGKFGIFEEDFYDDFYPFPNITFIVSNKKMAEVYGIRTTGLKNGLRKIYKKWLKNWDRKTYLYELEKNILKKISKLSSKYE